jgi:tetratricopeptide (TPR) repeat protein
MKSEHRHELKTNELAEWLRNFPQWAKDNRNTIIYVSVLLLVVIGLYVWKYYSKNVIQVNQQVRLTQAISGLQSAEAAVIQAQRQGQDLSYKLFDPAEELKSFAQTAENDEMAALALIKRGQALRLELLYRPGPVNASDKQAAINQAKQSYQKALDRNPKKVSLQALAKYGLALCELELGNTDQSKEQLAEIIENSDMQSTTTYQSAKVRLDTISDYREKITFAPAPKPQQQQQGVIAPEPDTAQPPVQLDIPEVDIEQKKGEPNSATVKP